MKKREKN